MGSRVSIVVEPVPWDEWQHLLMALRIEVFVKEQNVPMSLEDDGLDCYCTHVAASVAGEGVIATGRLENTGKIGRLAVNKHWRGQGVGEKVLKCLLQVALDQGMTEVHLSAQTNALPLYSKNGFIEIGNTYQEAGIPHQKMVKSLL